MGTCLYLAPAASGKTAYAVELARKAAHQLQSEVRVCVATQLQAQAWQQRLAQAGGAIGVRVHTFDGLTTACLVAAGEAYTELSQPVLYRLIRSIVDELNLDHYGAVKDKPGFIQILQDLIRELKSARIEPAVLRQSLETQELEPRLEELVQVYERYQARLQERQWADRWGRTWLALEALSQRAPHVACDWPMLIIDGFDSFTEAQLKLLTLLARRVGKAVFFLGGPAAGESRYQRYRQTRQRLEAALDVQGQPMPNIRFHQEPLLRHLAANLFDEGDVAWLAAEPALTFVEASDRVAEVRVALRWLKQQLTTQQMAPRYGALLARHIAPYRPFILQTAAEFGLPLRLVEGRPLSSSPVIAALIDLLRLGLPETTPQGGLPRRRVVAAWRSPYFKWPAFIDPEGRDLRIGPADADLLDRVARHGRVTGRLIQWQEALQTLASYEKNEVRQEGELNPGNLPTGHLARLLLAKFERFRQYIRPPADAMTMRHFVIWLESLIGPDLELSAPDEVGSNDSLSLNMVAQVKAARPEEVIWDVAALRTVKEILRGLVWSETAMSGSSRAKPLDYARFFSEFMGVIEASQYQPPLEKMEPGVLVADTVQARGVSFRAVALLGLGEGEFPAVISEDPFLRDQDRQRLQQQFGLPLEPSTLSAEREFFYEAISRARDRLLVTRPRLADSGAVWVASPFWQELRRLVQDTMPAVTDGLRISPHEAASWPELLESLALRPKSDEAWRWVQETAPQRWAALQAASQILNERQAGRSSRHDGDLRPLAVEFASRFDAEHPWSASRLEQYRNCAYRFFVGSVLELEPRYEPVEGLEPFQLGNIYHHIFEKIYRYPDQLPEGDDEALSRFVTEKARSILDAAPIQEGFRETAWWEQTKLQIVADVIRTVQVLGQMADGFKPWKQEIYFGGSHALEIVDGQDRFRLHGFVDRIDRDESGYIRIIDYKLGSPVGFQNRDVMQGKKLQLPLYALAAQEALGLGPVVDGFYWHYRSAEPSKLTLAGYDGGAAMAMETAVGFAWEAVRGARAGDFRPRPPDGGCPAFCPAVSFCWHYSPGF